MARLALPRLRDGDDGGSIVPISIIAGPSLIATSSADSLAQRLAQNVSDSQTCQENGKYDNDSHDALQGMAGST